MRSAFKVIAIVAAAAVALAQEGLPEELQEVVELAEMAEVEEQVPQEAVVDAVAFEEPAGDAEAVEELPVSALRGAASADEQVPEVQPEPTIAPTPALAAKDTRSPQQVQTECIAQCQHMEGFDKSRQGSCEPYVHMRPAPKMFRVCDTGYRAGFQSGCELGCQLDLDCSALSFDDASPSAAALQNTCKRFATALPRPKVSNICNEGFKSVHHNACMQSRRKVQAYLDQQAAVFMNVHDEL